MNKQQREKLNDNTKHHVEWCEKYIADFIKQYGFNPYDALTGNEEQPQKLYGLCIEYLYEIESAIDEANKRFERRMNEIVFHTERSIA